MGRNRQGREAVSESPEIRITYPDWVGDLVEWDRAYETAEDRVRLAIELSRENVERGTGGPFGAAVFERDGGRLVSVGMNLVVAHRNSTLHAEMIALMMAESRLQSYSLGAKGMPPHDVAASCDPCAMCLGGLLWSGVSRVLCGARREDAHILEFDEGPVFPESYRYLENRGIEIQRGVLREEARAVLQLYRDRGGVIYNG